MNPMPALRNKITAIFGRKGSGKTFLAAGMYGKEDRAICYNLAEDIEFRSRATVFCVGGSSNADKLWRYMKKPLNQFRIDFIPTDLEFGRKVSADSLETISQLCWDARDVTLYFDEAHMLLSSGWAPAAFRTLYLRGRHHQVSIVMIQHRMAAIPKEFTYNVDTFIFFQTSEPTDLDAIADRCGIEVAEKVIALRPLDLRTKPPTPGQYYEWDANLRIGKTVEQK
jgi:hypothetical protein